MYCKYCGFKIDDDSEYCQSCGIKQSKQVLKPEVILKPVIKTGTITSNPVLDEGEFEEPLLKLNKIPSDSIYTQAYTKTTNSINLSKPKEPLNLPPPKV